GLGLPGDAGQFPGDAARCPVVVRPIAPTAAAPRGARLSPEGLWIERGVARGGRRPLPLLLPLWGRGVCCCLPLHEKGGRPGQVAAVMPAGSKVMATGDGVYWLPATSASTISPRRSRFCTTPPS